MTAAEPIILQNIPTSSVTAILNNDYAPEMYQLPMGDALSNDESSYLHIQLDDNVTEAAHPIETTNDNWCDTEKLRIIQLSANVQWSDATLHEDIQPPRKMGPKCSSEFCKNSSKRDCYEFDEKFRNEIFNFFWQQLNWPERKVYVCDLIKVDATKIDIHRNASLKYFLRMNGVAKCVCKKMFINTIGIGENTFRIWMSQLRADDNSPTVDTVHTNVIEKSAVHRTEKVVRVRENAFKSKQEESPDYWIREKVKKARERGEAYFGYCSKSTDQTSGRRSYGRTIREQRALGPPCTSSFCERSTKRQCSRFTETIRQIIFDRFWKDLGWDERKAFINESVDIMQPKRRTCIDVQSSRRGVTCSYFLYIDDKRHNVCRQLFLSTLGIKEATVQYWLMQNTTEPGQTKEDALFKSKRIHLPKKN